MNPSLAQSDRSLRSHLIQNSHLGDWLIRTMDPPRLKGLDAHAQKLLADPIACQALGDRVFQLFQEDWSTERERGWGKH